MMKAVDILNASILIVDDQESNVMLLELLLTDAGYTQVSSTMNSEEVCALHRKHHYDLILLDLQLPGMDGFQVMEALKTNLDDPYLPVIVLTAQPGHKLRALQAGAKDFISKPFDLIEVKTRIHNVLEVRLLYKKLAAANLELEQKIEERTAELRESEARFRSLTELAADWYWEQDESGKFTKVSGPVLEMLGIQVEPLLDNDALNKLTGHKLTGLKSADYKNYDRDNNGQGNNNQGNIDQENNGWNIEERAALLAKIAARQPFLDALLSRVNSNGQKQTFRVSGQPMFNQHSCFIGYRGIGVEVIETK